jgi:hypothetical protein
MSLGMLATPASASTPGTVVHHSSTSSVVGGVNGKFAVKSAAKNSTLIAGYSGAPSAGILSDTSTFTAPSFTCANSTDIEDFSIGPYIYDSTGYEDAASDIQFVCVDGAPYYSISAYTGEGGNNYVFNVTAGDVISATLSENATTGETTAVTTDLTTGYTVTSAQANGADGNPDVALSEGVLTYYADVPTFTTITQANCLINGVPIKGAGLALYNLKGAHDVQVKTDAAKGSTLENVFKANI